MRNQNSPAIRDKAPALKNSARRRRFFFVVSVLVMLAAPSTFAARRQQTAPGKVRSQDQPIRLKTDLIELHTVVTDAQGKIITGLKQDDFEILENKRAQVISFFSAESLKAERRNSETTGAPPPRRRLTTASPPHRTIVFLVDTLFMHEPINLLRARQELLKFIDESLTDEDMAAVVATGGGLGVLSQFTQDKQVLRMAVNHLSLPFMSPRADGFVAQALDAEEASERTRLTLLSVKAVATQLAEMPGQRLIFMISDGFPMADLTGFQDTSDLHAAISRATRSGVVLYTMLAKGLTGPSVFSPSRGNPPDLAPTFRPGPPKPPDNLGEALIKDRLSEHGLERLAAGTGGEALLTTNDLNGAMAKAAAANSFYYALGYYPTNPDAEPRLRNIEVRVKGHPDYRVRAQSGYLASELIRKPPPAGDSAEGLLKALGAPLDLGDLSIEAVARFLPLREDNAQVSVEVLIDNRRLGYQQQGDSLLTRPTLLIGALDSAGKTVGVWQDVVEIRLSRAQLARARQSKYRYIRRLALKPGLYQIRLGVRDSQTGLMGTASAWVEVPKL